MAFLDFFNLCMPVCTLVVGAYVCFCIVTHVRFSVGLGTWSHVRTIVALIDVYVNVFIDVRVVIAIDAVVVVAVVATMIVV